MFEEFRPDALAVTRFQHRHERTWADSQRCTAEGDTVVGVEVPEAGSELIRSGDDQISDLVGGLGAGLDRRTAREPQHPHALHRPTTGLGSPGGVTVERGAGGGFGVNGVGLAAPTATLPVGPVHLDDGDAFLGEVAGQAGPVGPGAFHPDAGHYLAVAAQPSQQAFGSRGASPGTTRFPESARSRR